MKKVKLIICIFATIICVCSCEIINTEPQYLTFDNQTTQNTDFRIYKNVKNESVIEQKIISNNVLTEEDVTILDNMFYIIIKSIYRKNYTFDNIEISSDISNIISNELYSSLKNSEILNERFSNIKTKKIDFDVTSYNLKPEYELFNGIKRTVAKVDLCINLNATFDLSINDIQGFFSGDNLLLLTFYVDYDQINKKFGDIVGWAEYQIYTKQLIRFLENETKIINSAEKVDHSNLKIL